MKDLHEIQNLFAKLIKSDHPAKELDGLDELTLKVLLKEAYRHTDSIDSHSDTWLNEYGGAGHLYRPETSIVNADRVLRAVWGSLYNDGTSPYLNRLKKKEIALFYAYVIGSFEYDMVKLYGSKLKGWKVLGERHNSHPSKLKATYHEKYKTSEQRGLNATFDEIWKVFQFLPKEARALARKDMLNMKLPNRFQGTTPSFLLEEE